jgi:4'-phosphopantetheinyl transferase
MEIFICDEIESCDEQWLAAALERLPAERRQRALRYRQTADRIRSAAAYLLLANALTSQFSVLGSPFSVLSSPLSVPGSQSSLPGLSYGEWGKPYLAGRPEVQFSMSHCRGAVAVAVDTTPVGVDIEPLQRFDETMAAQFCTPEEYRAIITANNRDAMFTEMWTRKESCLKQCGVAPPADLRLIPTSGRKKFHIFHTGRHILAACSDYPHPAPTPTLVPLAALMP